MHSALAYRSTYLGSLRSLLGLVDSSGLMLEASWGASMHGRWDVLNLYHRAFIPAAAGSSWTQSYSSGHYEKLTIAPYDAKVGEQSMRGGMKGKMGSTAKTSIALAGTPLHH